jgi:capsular polysaccharide biosynthesis protein
MSRWHLPRPNTLSGTVAVLASPDAFSNFGHWCLDILPKINLLQRAGWQPDSIDFYFVGHTQKEFQLQSLAAAGIPLDKVVQMKGDETLQADLLLMPFLNSYHFTSFQPSTINYLRNLYGSLSSAPRFSGGPERIFISRSDASFRRVSNEPELRQVLEPLGFHFIALGGCSLQETADIMSNAKIVVSPNGSGLVSVLFAKPGCFVLEFSHPRYTTTFHWKLCCAAALRYAHLVSDDEPVSKGAEQRLLYADLTISPSRLLGALDQAGVL